jgi:hypothetical protein
MRSHWGSPPVEGGAWRHDKGVLMPATGLGAGVPGARGVVPRTGLGAGVPGARGVVPRTGLGAGVPGRRGVVP